MTASGVSSAIVEPRLFLENLLLPVTVGPVREEGRLAYPVRDDYAVSWSSHLDVADVAARLLAERDVTGTVSVGALPGLIGADIAEGFSTHLGHPVTFEALSPDEYGELITPLFGAGAAGLVVDSYHHRRTQPDEVIPRGQSAQKLLGISPRSVQQWLKDLNM